MRLTATEAYALSLDEKRSRPYGCECGRTVTGYCAVTNPERCPFALLPRLGQPEAAEVYRVLVAQPDREFCE